MAGNLRATSEIAGSTDESNQGTEDGKQLLATL